MIQAYFNDVEHGFFHGICSCIIAYLIDSTINPHTWVSIILHDFLKTNGYAQPLHDTHLEYFYNQLQPITYRHSGVVDQQTEWTLVKADRIELRRYDDHRQWVDGRYAYTYGILDKDIKSTIDAFYLYLRPVLSYFYINRDSIFIRHGYERLTEPYTDEGRFPPKSSYWRGAVNAYAIEIDTAPFSNQRNTAPHLLWQDNHCSNHGGAHLWNKVKGFITHESFSSLGGILEPIDTRDHLMAKSNIPLKEWKFVLSNITEQEQCIVEHLSLLGAGMVDQSILFDMFMIHRLLYNRLTVLNRSYPIMYQ